MSYFYQVFVIYCYDLIVLFQLVVLGCSVGWEDSFDVDRQVIVRIFMVIYDIEVQVFGVVFQFDKFCFQRFVKNLGMSIKIMKIV